VLPEDIKALLHPVIAHRLIIRPEAELRGRTTPAVLADILKETPLDLGSVA
jgi:MoxR-like ATPase